MKRLAVVTAIVGVTFALAQAASASTQITWVGGQDQGSDNLPCDGGAHWVLSPAQGITSASLTLHGNTVQMQQSGGGSFSADTDGIVNVGDVVTVVYEGDNDTAFLKLSHCIPSSSPSPTHSPSETPSETPSESVSPSESETTTPSESHTPSESVLGTSHTKHPSTGPTSGGTAFTGSDVAGFGLLAAGLAALGLGSLYVARKRGANLDR